MKKFTLNADFGMTASDDGFTLYGIDDFNHLMDAMRYGLEDMLVGPAFSFD